MRTTALGGIFQRKIGQRLSPSYSRPYSPKSKYGTRLVPLFPFPCRGVVRSGSLNSDSKSFPKIRGPWGGRRAQCQVPWKQRERMEGQLVFSKKKSYKDSSKERERGRERHPNVKCLQNKAMLAEELKNGHARGSEQSNRCVTRDSREGIMEQEAHDESPSPCLLPGWHPSKAHIAST